MIRIKKIIFSAFIFFSVNLSLMAQTIPPKVAKGEEAWRYLKEAEDLYEANDYGQAFSKAEKAKQVKKADSDWQNYHLENMMKKSKIRKAGNKIDVMLQTLSELEMKTEIDIINYHLEKKGPEYFKNRYDLLTEYVSHYQEYPEADLLISKIYNIEGEDKIALDYLSKAYSNLEYLDIPSVKYEILEFMAKISLDCQNYEDYEKYLLLIIADNKFYSDKGFMKAITNLISDKNDSLEKFFLLYRCDEIVGLSSLIELTSYYRSFGQAEKALRCSALASIMAVTRIDNVINERYNNYEYTTFGSLLNYCSKYSDIVDWGNENKVWQLFYDFADCSALNGNFLFARSLYTVLAQFEPEEYWRKLSEQKLIR